MRSEQHIKVIILAGSRDFGPCPLASRLPTALWPVAGKPALEHLLRHLSREGIKRAVVCSSGGVEVLKNTIGSVNSMQVDFLDESLPVGSAGCIRKADKLIRWDSNSLFLVFPASIIRPPKIDTLIRAHRQGQSDLTVVFNPSAGDGRTAKEPAGIYVCNPTIMEHIPKDGYFDIKEGLIPEMLRAGKSVHVTVLPSHAGNFRGHQSYISAISNYLEHTDKVNGNCKLRRRNGSQVVWSGANVSIEPGVRIYGPVVVMDSAHICDGAVIFGPTVVGRGVTIGRNSIVTNSVLWDGAQLGPNCEIQRCVIDYHATVRANTIVQEKVIPFRAEGMIQCSVNRALKVAKSNAVRLQHALQAQLDKISEKLPSCVRSYKRDTFAWLGASVVFIVFLWSYWPGFVDLWNIWQRSDEYSSGLLVPFLAVYILWSRRHDIAKCPIRPCIWGVFAFIAAQAVRVFGLFFMYGSAERLSVALSIAALVLLLFGWQLFRKVSTVLLFLCLMLPWPNRVQTAVALPLQRWATSSAVFCLEVLGYAVVRDGNIIHIGDATVAVAEACSGLRMVTAFFVVGGLVVLLVNRAWWEKLIIIVSSLPIALLCNTVRLAVTAIAFTVLSGEYWEKIFHDFGGYAMMPLALAAIIIELWLLTKLTTLPTKEEAVIITRSMGEETQT